MACAQDEDAVIIAFSSRTYAELLLFGRHFQDGGRQYTEEKRIEEREYERVTEDGVVCLDYSQEIMTLHD